MTRSAQLQTYLSTLRPWEWGISDCCSLVADWCKWQGHSDPMARWRGRYDSEAEAYAYIERAHGLVNLLMLGMIDAQISECDAPILGDVGVVRVEGERGPEAVGAIYGGKRWHMRSPNGVFSASMRPCDVLATWRV